MAKPRIVKITGYLALNETDPAYKWGVKDIAESFSGLTDLTITEMPNAVMTPQGVRTDLADEYAASDGPR
jgi:hypothetical protein